MAPLADARDELAAANHILGNEGILDAFGHVSIRHPDNPDHFFLSRARAPELVADGDLVEFDLTGEAVSQTDAALYLERYIHAAAYAARPEVGAVCHSHTPSILPFSVATKPLQAVIHSGRFLGAEVPVWDLAREFPGEWSPLVRNLDYGKSLAGSLGAGTVALLRGHGCVVVAADAHEIVQRCVSMDRNARVQEMAARLGDYKPLNPGECDTRTTAGGRGDDRAWEFFRRRAER